ncbi:MAG: ABC transporter ATP-binding protein [Chloroflexi bacterium]|nr:ABC transporter ATP-binding protein [Chloroflexota bacterium]
MSDFLSFIFVLFGSGSSGLGVLTDNLALPQGLTVEELLTFSARAFGFPKKTAIQLSDEVIAQVQMGEHRKERIGYLSSGLKRRVEIGQALINRSRLVFLDEPTIGLDPLASREIRELIKQLHAQGTTIFYTTHLLNEVEELGTDVLVINHGEVVLVESLKELQRKQEIFVRVTFDSKEEFVRGKDVLLLFGSRLRLENQSILIAVKGDERQQLMNKTLETLQVNQIKIAGVSFYQDNLEEIYRRVMEGQGDII